MNWKQGLQPCFQADLYGNASCIPVFVGGIHHVGFYFDERLLHHNSASKRVLSRFLTAGLYPVVRNIPYSGGGAGGGGVFIMVMRISVVKRKICDSATGCFQPPSPASRRHPSPYFRQASLHQKILLPILPDCGRNKKVDRFHFLY